MAGPASTTRSTSRPIRPWPTSHRSIYLDHRGNGRSEPVRRRAGRWRSGATTCARFASAGDRKADRAGRVVRRHGGDGLRDAPPGASGKLILISTEAKGGSHLEKRVELFERFGGPEVGALARRRFLENEGQPDEAAVAAVAPPGDAALHPHAARAPMRCSRGDRAAGRAAMVPTRPGRAEGHATSTAGPTFTASSVRRW